MSLRDSPTERIPIFSITRMDLAFSGLALAMTRSKSERLEAVLENPRTCLRRQSHAPRILCQGIPDFDLSFVLAILSTQEPAVADERAGLLQYEGPHCPTVALVVGHAIGDELSGLLLRPWLVVPDVLHHVGVERHRSYEPPVVRLPGADDESFRLHVWVVVQLAAHGRLSRGIRAYRRLVPPPRPDSVFGAIRSNASLSIHC